MTIQFNTDKNITVHETFGEQLNEQLNDELSRFDEYLTRVEVYLSDENGNKDALNDKKCTLEARLKGRNPIVVSDQDDTYELAVTGAIEKLISSLETVIGKLQNH